MVEERKFLFDSWRVRLFIAVTVFVIGALASPLAAYDAVALGTKDLFCPANTREDCFTIRKCAKMVRLEAHLSLPPNTTHCGIIHGRNFVIDDLSTSHTQEDHKWNIGPAMYFEKTVRLEPGNYQIKTTLAIVCPGEYKVYYWKKCPPIRALISAVVKPRFYRFGSKPVGSTESHSFTVINKDKVPLKIISIVSDNPKVLPVSTTFSLPYSLAPGGKMTFSVTFKAPKSEGMHSAIIKVNWQKKGKSHTTPIPVTGISKGKKPKKGVEKKKK
ncbi:MAG: hypothetical protein GTO45_03005 [Candidatus Aminicenantes bacterium]|nr:hypothetical protein [Candidatus Aminicenantes bacterium]NIM77695.1 hypothetical protein [Candidatus Aminicenantes bacterium]NIN17008.1 hypothetical protein [Candidatus Aminicenantes bacterium]NIN40901.1 hypothetical protein [Candidatus Aminicenantes bacterium]NIN83706.1 hypothetical protein [Candidatus Aminicenantes bacterium]